MIRNPYVAGYFYPATAAELKTTVARRVDKKPPGCDRSEGFTEDPSPQS